MINLEKFCATDDVLGYLKTPFIFDDKIIATNGHIIIMVPNDGNSSYQQSEKIDFKGLIDTIKSTETFMVCNKDEIVFSEMEPCNKCRGSGKSGRKVLCEECDGDGLAEASNDFSTYYDLVCESCGGDGYTRTLISDEACSECAGTGEVIPFMSTIEILGVHVQEKYLRLIIEEDDLQFAAHSNNIMLIYRLGEGTIGAIMGVGL